MIKYRKYAAALACLIFLIIVSIIQPGKDSTEKKDLQVQRLDLKPIDIVKVPYVSTPSNITTVIQAEMPRGSNLNDLLRVQGLSREEASSIVYEISPLIDLRSIRSGEIFELKYTDKVFSGLQTVKSENTIVEVVRDSDTESGFRAFERDRELKTYVKQIRGTIDNSLYNAALEAGMDPNTLYDLIHLLSFDVDFQRDIQPGDTFHVAFEVIYDEEGEPVGEGKILSADMSINGRDIDLFYYTDLKGDSDYFNSDGQTVRKTLLKTPINGAVITSGYGMRVSPITGFTHRHQALDFGAPSGTPIYASGDGVIELAEYNSVYGNYIQIRHVNGYRTLYGHMTNYAKGMRTGVRVKQGQVIGYVGSTGMSTGPHLHYEVSYWGTKVNPASVKSPPGRTLSGDDKILFDNLKESYIASFK